MLLRLNVKLAEVVDGLDLSHCAEGDIIDVSDRDAALLLAEKWAEPAADGDVVDCEAKQVEREVAADEGVARGWRRAGRLRAEQKFQVFKAD